MEERDYILWLCCLEKISLSQKRKLMMRYREAGRIFKAAKKEILGLDFLTQEEKEYLIAERTQKRVLDMERELKEKRVSFCVPGDGEYPYRLGQIYDPPFGIFYLGKMPGNGVTIAMVGARDCSNYGKEEAYCFAEVLAKNGVQIVSGLARGIDGFSHGGALHGGGRTYGVLGCGIDVVYPPEHKRMYQEILSEGGILTEYPMGMLPYRWNFPPRNRIISGLSDGVFVVEARKKSGSLITAELALEQGRDVFAMPGRAGDPLSLGTNRLIKQGAFLVDKPEDILDFYRIGYQKINEKKDLLLETEEKIVYANLSLEEKHINRLVQETGMEIGKITQILFRLEEKGLVGQTGQYVHSLLSK